MSRQYKLSDIPSLWTKLFGDDFFSPAAIALTYDSAVEAVTTSTSDKGLGIFELTYRDTIKDGRQLVPDPNGGHYRLYLQVERVR